jgi:large subunit ribosomal protein L2
MPIKVYRPVTKGRRLSSVQDFSDITRDEPEKSLIVTRKVYAGRSGGKISVRHQGGGAKRFLRDVDFVRAHFDVPARIDSVEYDPNRGARIGLIIYRDGRKSYMLLPDGMKVGDTVVSSQTEADIAVGNRLPLEKIPVGTPIHAVD